MITVHAITKNSWIVAYDDCVFLTKEGWFKTKGPGIDVFIVSYETHG